MKYILTFKEYDASISFTVNPADKANRVTIVFDNPKNPSSNYGIYRTLEEARETWKYAIHLGYR
jgi:hypothetical protein